MNKKLIAVAVASALGAPAVAMAQASTVQIYGTMFLEYNWIDTGTGWKDIDLLQVPGSNIGFKGEEALGGGLSVWFQCESSANINGTAAAPTNLTGGFCSRNSAIGFKGGFGNVFLGQWDTPFKRTQGQTRGMLNETGMYGTGFLMGGNSSTYVGNAGAGAFIRRQANTINYDSPNFGGFQVMGAVNTGNQATGQSSGSTGAKPRLWSIGLQYANGPLVINGAYERHKDFHTNAPTVATPSPTAGTITVTPPGGAAQSGFSGTDKGWHVGATYTFPVGGGLKLGGIFMKLDYDLPGGRDIDHRAWQVAADWKIVGPHGLRGGFVKALDSRGSGAVGGVAGTTVVAGTAIGATDANNGANLWEILYYYTMSKRTEVGIGYAKLDNDTFGRYTLGGLPTTSGAAGANMDGFAVHVKHTF